MKKRILACALLLVLLTGCAPGVSKTDGKTVAATTWPVAQFAGAVVSGTDITVTRVISEPVSCLHDYSLSVDQMKAAENSQAVVISGAGLEDFMSDALASCPAVIDASQGIETTTGAEGVDPHIWMDPENAVKMVQNIAAGLAKLYPEDRDVFLKNADAYCKKLDDLDQYGQDRLRTLKSRELVTFHDGFAYFAKAFDLTIAAAIEEEAGSEASAADLKGIVALVEKDKIPAVFTETNGSTAAASVIESETGVPGYTLDMCLGETDYLTAMKNNIDTIGEALG
jgi:zinc transport system substrate-binding protein